MMVVAGGPGVFAPGETRTSTLSGVARGSVHARRRGSAWRAWPAAEPQEGRRFTRLGPSRPRGRAGD